MRKKFLLMLTLLVIALGGSGKLFAAEGNVAKVGNTEYATIDEAIANWTNGTTLTLLADVTLSDVIQLSSTEHHILDLGTYTMTAASKKDAIQIVNNGRSSASYTLDIKADAENPGGITATGKAVVKTTGKSGVKDRPIIRFYNGVFTGTNVIYHSGSNGTNCPQFQFHGGVFNGTVYANRALIQFYGGTFNGSLQMSVDSSAYALVAGGTFKQLSNLYGSALNSDKFTIGSGKGVYDKEVYIDDNGNYVIAAAEPSEGIEAAVAKTPGTNDYLAYSKVATEGQLNYTDVEVALKNNNTTSAKVTVYAEEVDMDGINFKGTIVVPEGKTVKIVNAPEGLKTEGNVVIVKPVAKIGDVEYLTLQAAVEEAQAGDEIVVIANFADVTVNVTKNLTISGNVTLNNVGINANGADALTVKGLTFTGNSWINSGTAEALTVSGVTANVAPNNTSYTNSRSAFISLGRSEGQELALTVENSNITVTAAGADAILGWAKITAATITVNVIKGSNDGYFTNADAIKFMSIADGAEFVVNNNEIYSNYNGIVFAQNTTRDNAYSVSADANKFYGGADHIWIEISGGNTVHATVNAKSTNKVNGNAFAVGDIKYHSGVIKNWTSYAGVDVVTDSNGKVIGGTLASYSNAESVAEGYEIGAGGVVGKASVAEVNGTKYTSIEAALDVATAGSEIKLLADIEGDITVPAKVTLNGNGFAVSGTITAAGEITFAGVTKTGNFGVKNTNTVVNIPAGASLQLTGTDRMVIGHGCTFNITGTIAENAAKTADKATLTPSLVMPGASFTGAGVTFNVTNAYISAPSSYCSSSKSASGTFDFNITNSIWENAGKLAFESQSTAATVNFDLKNSVLNTGSHLVFGVSRGEVVVDNSNVNVGKSNQIENQSTMTIKNGSVVNGSVATSSNAKNPGTVIVENATYAVTGEFSGSDLGIGTLIIKKGATVSAGSITKANITIDAEGMTASDAINLTANLSKLAGELSVINNDKLEAKIVDGKIVLAAKPVAKIGETPYATLESAFKAATSGCTIDILSDVTVDYNWDARYTGGKFSVPVTINGNGKTIKFTASVNDNNYQAPFRFEADATVKNLTIDMSAATDNRFRAISSKGNLTVDGCKFIGKDESLNCRAIIFGEGAGANVGNLAISVTNSKFINWKRGITDNENGQDVKTATITGNTLENAAVYVSAYENVTFTGNTVEGAYVDIRSYTANSSLNVTATGNTLEENTDTAYNYIKATGNIDQEGFKVYAVAKIGDVEYTTIEKAYAALQEGDEIVILKKGSYALKVKNNVTITGAVAGVEFANIGAFGCNGANVTFNNVTFTYANNSTYKGLQHSGNLVYNNCTFNGQVFLYGASETFNNCTFKTTDSNNYNVWTYGAKKVAFVGCTFNSAGKSVLIYAESATVFNDVTVTACTFKASTAVDGKAAIEMDSSLTGGINLTIDAETTASGFGKGNVSNNSLWNNKKGNADAANNDITVTVDNTVVLKPIILALEGEGTAENPYLINNLEELVWFRDNVDKTSQDGSTQYAGKYIKLTADIDLAGINWNPIGSMSSDHGSFKGVFDGDNHIIKNLNCEQAGNGLGLFARTAGNAEIKNLKLNNVTVKSTDNSSYVGGVVGNAYASTKIENVHISGDVQISGRGYIGGIAGHGYVVMDNVSVVAKEGSLITSTFWCAGGILGYAGEGSTNIMNANVEGITITSAAGGLGAIVGMAEDNNGTQPISGSNLSAKNVDIKTYVGAYGTSYANYALGYLCGGNETSILTGELLVENVNVITSTGEEAKVVDAVANVDGKIYFNLAIAIATIGNGDVTINLLRDVTLDYNARDEYGIEGTTSVTINGNNHTLTLNQKNSDWASIGLVNGKLVLNNMTIEKTGYGDTSGAWNTHAIIFSCPLEMTNVTVNNGIAVQAGATLNNVTINEAGEYYGLWINGNGQTVTMNGGAINAPNAGRGIKIADQYIDTPTKVTLNVTGTAFTTAKKAAVLVSSKAGAKIAASNVNIENVVADNVNFVWVDEDWAANYGNVEVTGAEVAQESIESFVAAISKTQDGNTNIIAYYKTLPAAIAAVQAGETIELINDITATTVIELGKSITINGNGHKVTSSATRVFRVTTSNTEVTLNDVNMVSSAKVVYPNDVRGISIDIVDNVKLTLNNSSVDFTDASANDWAYAVNVTGGDNHAVTINGGTYEGANVINVRGTNNTVVVKDATLNSMYPNNDVYYGACIYVVQDSNSSVTATGNTFNGSNAIAFNVGYTPVTESKNTDNTQKIVAKIGAEYYTSLVEAFAEVEDNETIKVLHNVELTEAVVNTKTITLDLNGKTVVATDNATGSYAMITNKGNLTIVGEGKLQLTATNDRDWNAYSSVISNTVGGKLTVNGGTIEHLGGTDMAYGIDNLTNGKGTYAETVVKGGTVKSTYRAIRQFLNGVEAQNILTVNGGTIEGANKSIWMQDPSKNANSGTLTVGAEAKLYGNAYLTVTAGSTEWPVEVAIAAEALQGESTVLTSNVPEEYIVKNNNGVWGVFDAVAQVNGTNYAFLQEAIDNSTENATITLLSNVEQEDGVIVTDKKLTIDLNQKTFTVTNGASTNNRNFKINGASVVTIKNGTMVAAGDYSSGAYGTVRTEGTANVTLTGLKLYNYRGNGLNIKALSGTTVAIDNTEIYSQYGGGIEAAGGTITLAETVKVEQKGMYTAPYNSMAISVNGGGKVTVNGGTYSTECITPTEANNQGTSHGPWVVGVLNSGGTLIINGGTFSNDNYGDNSLATAARGAVLADTKAKVEIYGGTFNALKAIIDIQNNLGDANNNPSVLLAGGTYNADPRISAQYGSNLITLAEGYDVKNTTNGTWVVKQTSGELTRTLPQGWSWFSSYVKLSGADGFTTLTRELGTAGVQIKDEAGRKFAQYSVASNSWYGELKEASSTKMYSIKTSAAVEVNLAGEFYGVENYEPILRDGWNYLSYPHTETLEIALALQGFKPVEGDIIKSKSASAIYLDGSWYNAIELNPGEGYMYRNQDGNKQVSYTTEATRSAAKAYVSEAPKYWSVDATQYSSNMTMIATMDVDGADYEVAAFVNGELRGSARPIYVEAFDQYLVLMTINGDEVANVTFKYYDINAGEEYDFNNVAVYSDNAVLGSTEEPYALTRGTTGIGEATLSDINIYPNPTTTDREINLQATCDKVEVFSALGVKVAEYQNVDTIDALETAGTYVIRVTLNGDVKHCRLVVK